jgi:hypothetical protein
MTHCQSDPDANEISRSHFARYVAAAGRLTLLDAAAAEDDPQALIRFAQYRFHDLRNRFTAGFLDSDYAIPGFLPAARRAMRRSNSSTHEAEQPESTAAE